MKKRILSILTVCFVIISMSLSAFAHGGRTDSSGGHKDNKNKSGLGGYHYHCGGYPAHLHTGGVCPYTGGGSSSSSYSSVPKTVYATKVNVSNMPSSINAGESIQLKGSAYPSNAEDKEISWESSNTEIATVDYSGKLTALSVGTAVISAKTSRGTTTKYTVTVKEVVAESIAIAGKQDAIIIGEEIPLSVVFTPDNTTYKDIEWEIEGENIVSVDTNGKLMANAIGKTTVIAKHKELTDRFEIEVKPILAESIKISCINKDTGEEYEELRFEEGSEIELSAIVLPEDTTDATITWSVDNTDVAKVNSNGVFTAISEGIVVVTAETLNGLKDTIEVEVYHTSLIVNILAGIVFLIIVGGLIGGPIFLVIWIRKKIKKK